MDDYVRATYKTSGELTLLRLIGADGQMNPDLSHVDIIQDSDLNKSLKFYVSYIDGTKSEIEVINYYVCLIASGLCYPKGKEAKYGNTCFKYNTRIRLDLKIAPIFVGELCKTSRAFDQISDK